MPSQHIDYKHWHDVKDPAIRAYSPSGWPDIEVFPEGFTLQPRLQLREHLRGRGIRRLAVNAAAWDTHPEVRCSDALANYVRMRLFHEQSGKLMPELPQWLVKLA